MLTFSIEGEHPNLHLRIHDHKEDEDTILDAHPSLFKGSCPLWEAFDGKGAGGDMNWTHGAPFRAYFLAGRGHTRDKPPRIYRVLREDVATSDGHGILRPLFMGCLSIPRLLGVG
ncbi:hypothetical protein LIER_24309 [Lithospermum erythrorhizon]|uniref:Uncharacterized protein n=1 Tax=Lithospermum erythrorhizon TaxID=34254 RepID=A0AAV3R2V0_LITER